MDDTTARLEQLEGKYAEILTLLRDLSKAICEQTAPEVQGMTRKKVNAKAIIKQGMSAYYAGITVNPFASGTDEHEFWLFGHDNARDTWDEIRK